MIWLIGSRAVAENVAHPHRRPNDWDLMCNPDEVELIANHFSDLLNYSFKESTKYPGKYTIRGTKKVDDVYHYGISIEIDATDNHSRRFLTENDYFDFGVYQTDVFGLKVKYPDLKTLWAIKRSHANYPVHVAKTVSDLVFLSKECFGEEFKAHSFPHSSNGDREYLYHCLRDEAKERNKARDKRINFNKPVDKFFQGNIEREFNHDQLHRLTSYYETPIFEKHLTIPGHALIDMDSFFTMSFENQVIMVQEEAVVIGMERYWQFDKSLPHGIVFQKGLYKLLSDLCKGRFQDFALDNIQHIVKPRWNFMETFEERCGTVGQSN